ncbi:hypothetical protein BK131_03580 [Paenibacillus amylolyticus]|uniref:DUF4935 domain-containing protein n=2 Tax=Paenibacillus amylolyticus TaxID=1451 RepID=A0A1R1C4M4_PAEAM|nr:hypothetical protein BK131_03580 [Paenibacillus amylolyticus]
MFSNNEKPYGVVLDTNVLIYLFQPEFMETETFNKFMNCIIMKKIEIILPSIVKWEWDNLKDKKNTDFLNSITKDIEKHKNLTNFMRDEREKMGFINMIDRLVTMSKRSYLYNNGLISRNIDKILNDSYFTTVIERNNKANEIAIFFALEHKEPFFDKDKNKDKNQMADALIFFTTYEYFKAEKSKYSDIFFVTVNKKDYSNRNNDSILHPELQPYAEEIGLEFYNSLDRLLNKIDPDNQGYVEFMNKDNFVYLEDRYFLQCPSCSNEVHENADSIRPDLPSESYKLQCIHCGHTWETGITMEDFH